MINSHINPAHENLIAKELRGLGINNFAISHQSSPMIGYVDRANTAVVDAYLKPLLEEYVGNKKRNRQSGLSDYAVSWWTSRSGKF